MNLMIDGTERYKISPTPQCCNYAFFIGFMQMQNRRMTVSLAFLGNQHSMPTCLEPSINSAQSFQFTNHTERCTSGSRAGV